MSLTSARADSAVRAHRLGLSLTGVFAALGVVACMATQPVPWGPPGTGRLETYEAANRLAGLPWLLCAMTLAFRLRAPPRLGVTIGYLSAWRQAR